MSDRLPGSCWSNPIWYGRWRIYVGEPRYGSQFAYAYVHDDYDGAPDAYDSRHGYAASIEEAKAEIDEMEADLARQPKKEQV